MSAVAFRLIISLGNVCTVCLVLYALMACKLYALTVVLQTVLTCCTISSTSVLHLHLIILHGFPTQPTTVPSLQLVSGEYLAVTNNIVLSVNLTH